MTSTPAPTSTDTRPIALVTGGNRGLGRSTAVHLAAQGVDVVLTYRSSEAEAKAVVDEIAGHGRQAVALRLDTAQVGDFAGFADELGRVLREHWGRETVDLLVNNAGIGINAPFAETTEEQFDSLFDVHVKGVFFLTQRLLPLLADGGRIITVSTGLARFVGPGYAAYASAKGAVEVLTRYLAAELGPRGITVNAVAPGATGGTDFAGGVLRDNDDVRSMVTSTVALGRMGEPDDIGAAVAALLTSPSNWMTGQRVELSGGQRL